MCVPANISAFEVSDEVLANLREFSLANNIYWAMAEGHACEISVSISRPKFHTGELLTHLFTGSSQRNGERLEERW